MEYISILRQKLMGQPSFPAEGYPVVAVVGQQFCASYPAELTIVRKMLQIPQGNFKVTDAGGKLVFNVTGTFLSLRDRRVLLDVSGSPVVSLQEKIISLGNLYRGKHRFERFTIHSEKVPLLPFKTELDVFLASNTKEDICDFKIKSSWFRKLAYTIYAGNSSTIIAQMRRKRGLSSILLGRDKFAATVYPNVDQAFIVSIAVILEEMNDKTEANKETKSEPQSSPS